MENDNLVYMPMLGIMGANIKAHRLICKMNQAQLAFECNMEKASMSRIESGKTNITFLTLCKIAGALNLTVVQLISNT